MSRFDTLLVANRGEIACRVIRTARALGLTTVAVYSEADAGALHVRMADTAVPIGPAAARESYLRIETLLAACRQTGAQAIHPGYGFLSENAAFSRACRDAGLTFVGPSPEAIEALGNKSAAKRLAQRVGVPCLPGYSGADQAPATLLAEARRIGAPLMIKAAAGGGGRGMRRCDDVSDEARLQALLEAARGEALASFGNGDLLLERLVEQARHVEIQVFGDEHGHYVHLGERDCSTQRRHQKILEEAPGPGVSAELRQAMGGAAIRLAREVGYVGAGTVEFLLAPDGAFYFLEMNTRLQVEHPVTEAVTGLDLVEWQLRIAQGEALPRHQEAITFAGHAIEARLCAEDAFAGFAPQSGAILAWSVPRATGVRIDHGLASAASIPPHYDSMIAKVIAVGADREQARARLKKALQSTTVFGITTNRDYLLACLDAPEFAQAQQLSTRWLDAGSAAWRAPSPDARWLAIAAALLVYVQGRRYGPLADWASNGPRSFPVALEAAGRSASLRVTHAEDGAYRVDGEGWQHAVRIDPRSAGGLHAEGIAASDPDADDPLHLVVHLDGRRQRVSVVTGTEGGWLDAFGVCASYVDVTHAPPSSDRRGGSGRIVSSMHGQVTQVPVRVGQAVRRGELLIAIEAMKMEHRIEAPTDGTVGEIGVAVGQQIAPGRLLVAIEPHAPAAGSA